MTDFGQGNEGINVDGLDVAAEGVHLWRNHFVNGVDLPPVALRRQERLKSSNLKTSFLSVDGHVCIEEAGFSTVGEVLGSCVYQIGWAGFGGCSAGYRTQGSIGRTVVSGGSGNSMWVGFGAYVDALYDAWRLALGRLRYEAQMMGADGVVDVKYSIENLGNDTKEYIATGTAIRSRGTQHAKRPFVTALTGQSLSKLLQSGWIPVDLVFGISLGIRHDDWQMSMQTSSFAQNTEVTALTELVTHVRGDCRSQIAIRASRHGGNGIVVHSMDLDVWTIEPSENHRDHVAQATVAGTVIAKINSGAAPKNTLTMLPLRGFPLGAKNR